MATVVTKLHVLATTPRLQLRSEHGLNVKKKKPNHMEVLRPNFKCNR